MNRKWLNLNTNNLYYPNVQPKVVTHSDDEGARLAKLKEVANLPYMHRNPAV
jgi:hypothetical protein